jgi:hypothetical protein
MNEANKGVVNMFGTNDTASTSNDDPAMLDNVKQLASEPADTVASVQPQYMTTSTPTAQATSQTFAATPTNTIQSSTSGTSMVDEPLPSSIIEPVPGFSSSPLPEPPVTPMQQTMQQNDESVSDSDDTSTADVPIAAASMQPIDTTQLAGMKQQALDHLEPLVGHLDQSPEEAFKTTMMMIQANDNHTLLEKALEEAKKIEDDKARANAMLDIINEINYFSQVNQQ